MTLLNNLIKIGGSAVILKDVADRIMGASINREQTLLRKSAGMLALGVALGGAVGAVAGILYAPLGRKGNAAGSEPAQLRRLGENEGQCLHHRAQIG